MKQVRRFVALAIVFAALVPAIAAQTAGAFSGKWEGYFTGTRPDGSEDKDAITLNLEQKGKVLTGTAGPGDAQQWPIAKGAVDAGKATFEVQQPNGPLFKFTLSIVKGRLQGDMQGLDASGNVRGTRKLDAAKAK